MTLQYYKFTTPDGRAFYLLSPDRAKKSAVKCGGTYHGQAPLAEVRAVFHSAMQQKPTAS
jgi:hypothetical protein